MGFQTNGKGEGDHVASDIYKRANRWAAFSRRTAVKLMLLKGAMLDGCQRDASKSNVGGSLPQDSCEVAPVQSLQQESS